MFFLLRSDYFLATAGGVCFLVAAGLMFFSASVGAAEAEVTCKNFLRIGDKVRCMEAQETRDCPSYMIINRKKRCFPVSTESDGGGRPLAESVPSGEYRITPAKGLGEETGAGGNRFPLLPIRKEAGVGMPVQTGETPATVNEVHTHPLSSEPNPALPTQD